MKLQEAVICFCILTFVISCVYLTLNSTAHGQKNETRQNKLVMTPQIKRQRPTISNVTWTVILIVNYGFHDMLNNWWYWYDKLNLNMTVILIAEDDLTFSAYRNRSEFIVFKADDFVYNSGALSYNSRSYNKLVSKRPAHLLKFLRMGQNLIYSDSDIVWLKDPRPFFTGSYDMWQQMDGEGGYCTGFMAIKPTKTIFDFFEKWKLSLTKPTVDQTQYNALIKKYEKKYLFKLLPKNEFPDGREYFQRHRRKSAILVHNNFVVGHDKKVGRFRSVRLWVNHVVFKGDQQKNVSISIKHR